MAKIKVAFYSCKDYDRDSFISCNAANGSPLDFTFIEAKLDPLTAELARGHEAVCLFVNDEGDGAVLDELHTLGVKYMALRCAGTNNVDLSKASSLGIKVIHVPSYSPHAVAEFTVGLILTTVRKYHKAYNRVREGDFTLSGLVGFNLNGRTIGLIGTGRIGLLTGKILSLGMGSKVIAYDPYPNVAAAAAHGITYVDNLEALLSASDIISLHCPLMESTKYILNEQTLSLCKKDVVIVNASRGGLVETKGLIKHLKSGHIGAVGLDVYEGESAYFFHDSSSKIIQDDELARLLSFYNVFVTGHQAFLTVEALQNIADATIGQLVALGKGEGEVVAGAK